MNAPRQNIGSSHLLTLLGPFDKPSKLVKLLSLQILKKLPTSASLINRVYLDCKPHLLNQEFNAFTIFSFTVKNSRRNSLKAVFKSPFRIPAFEPATFRPRSSNCCHSLLMVIGITTEAYWYPGGPCIGQPSPKLGPLKKPNFDSS